MSFRDTEEQHRVYFVGVHDNNLSFILSVGIWAYPEQFNNIIKKKTTQKPKTMQRI